MIIQYFCLITLHTLCTLASGLDLHINYDWKFSSLEHVKKMQQKGSKLGGVQISYKFDAQNSGNF